MMPARPPGILWWLLPALIELSIGAGGISVRADFDLLRQAARIITIPAVRTDKYGNLYSAFSGFVRDPYPSAYAGSKVAGSPKCATNLSISRAGDYPYTISPPRWGDTSGASVRSRRFHRMARSRICNDRGRDPEYWGTSIAM